MKKLKCTGLTHSDTYGSKFLKKSRPKHEPNENGPSLIFNWTSLTLFFENLLLNLVQLNKPKPRTLFLDLKFFSKFFGVRNFKGEKFFRVKLFYLKIYFYAWSKLKKIKGWPKPRTCLVSNVSTHLTTWGTRLVWGTPGVGAMSQETAPALSGTVQK